MKRILTIIFCLCVIFTTLAMAETKVTNGSGATAQTHFSNPIKKVGRWFKHLFVKRKAAPQLCETANVNSLTLTRPEMSVLNGEAVDLSNPNLIAVSTDASDPEGDTLIYNYTVTGGKIIGTGPNVIWDLSEAEPGAYTITAGVDDGCGVCGKTETKQFLVFGSGDSKQIMGCPTVTISASRKQVRIGEIVSFQATSIGYPDFSTYPLFWNVNSGNIISGQNSDTISVLANWNSDDKGIVPSLRVADEKIGCQYSIQYGYGVEVLKP